MWVHEHTAATAASPTAVWQVLRDLDQWGAWDTSLEWVRLKGPFQVGSQVTMKPTGQDPITSVIVEATETSLPPARRTAGERPSRPPPAVSNTRSTASTASSKRAVVWSMTWLAPSSSAVWTLPVDAVAIT